jgi:hypothetical protein
MNINRNNYEIYFLNYLEGRLTTDETAGLLLFADENPDLKELIDGEGLIFLVPDEKISFFPKSALKKNIVSGIENESVGSAINHNTSDVVRITINEGNYEEFMIRYYENELEEVEKAELANFLKNSPTYIKEFETFRNTILKPEIAITYPHKSGLKGNLVLHPLPKRIFAIVSVAASVLLFSTLFLKYINQPDLKKHNYQLAGSNNNKIETVNPVNVKNNIASINPTNITTKNKSELADITSGVNGNLSKKAIVIRHGFEPITPNRKEEITERTTFEIPSALVTKQTILLASADIKAPATINRRTDFDGITSAAYYDPDPDVLPLKEDRNNIGSRLGSTLASGISQTAGTIAREPELGRLLRGKVSLSDLARLGIAGFNLVTDSKLSVTPKYDEDGNQKGYTIVDQNRKSE